MIWILLLTATLLLPATLALAGWAAHQRVGRQGPTRRRLRQAIALHALVFCVMYGGFVFVAFDSLAAQQPAEATAADGTLLPALSVGDGLALLGVALATGLSVLGAGNAVGVVGAAALGAIAEKPELFGRRWSSSAWSHSAARRDNPSDRRQPGRAGTQLPVPAQAHPVRVYGHRLDPTRDGTSGRRPAGHGPSAGGSHGRPDHCRDRPDRGGDHPPRRRCGHVSDV